jgi:addiction module HigA family antidote
MGNKGQFVFKPDYRVPPGETLLETMESLKISCTEMAERTGLEVALIEGILVGNRAITNEAAMALERVLGVSVDFWNRLEENYQGVRHESKYK